MTVGEIAAICGIPSAVTVAIVGFFVWLLKRHIDKRDAARQSQKSSLRRRSTRSAE